MAVRVVHQESIPAPLARGDEIAKLVVSAPGMEDISVPLFAGATIGERSFFGRISTALGYLVSGLAE